MPEQAPAAPVDPAGSRRLRRERLLLAGFVVALFAIYLANGARYQGADTLGAPYTALSLMRDGDFYIGDVIPKNQRGAYWVEPARHGLVSVYGYGPPLAALPLYRTLDLAVWKGRWTENRLLAAGKVAGALMTALAALLLAVTARRFTSLPGALAVALVFALGSPAWSVTSQALWKHSPAVCFTAAGLALLLWPAEARPRRLTLALAAIPLAFAVWCRENLALFVAAAAVYLLIERGRVAALAFAGVAALVAAVLVALNLHHFGEPLHSGPLRHGIAVARRLGASVWDTPLWLGLYGNFLSPSRGLFVYSPIFLASVWGAVIGWRDRERAVWLLMAAGAVLTFAPSLKWHFWWGGAGYGPRLMSDALPFFTLLLVPAWPRVLARRSLAVAAAALALFSVVVHGIGAWKFDGQAWDEPAPGRTIDDKPERLLSWRDSQLLFYLRLPDTRPDRIPWR